MGAGALDPGPRDADRAPSGKRALLLSACKSVGCRWLSLTHD